MASKRLLLIEDNPRIQLANKGMLEVSGYRADTAMNLAEARAYLALETPDAIVLDIMLPDGSGLDFLGEIRRGSDVPVLLLTALNTDNDMVMGLLGGADDYLPKPYDYKVLLARIEALLRRAEHVPDTIVRGALTLHILRGQAFMHERNLCLTGKEFACLLALVQNEGRMLSSEFLYETVWNLPMNNDTQAVRTVITRLRNKLSGSGFMIKTSRSKGYVFGEK